MSGISGIKQKLRGGLVSLLAHVPALGEALRFIRSVFVSLRFRINTRGCRIGEKTVLFCAYKGRSYADSPRALYEYMIRTDAYAGYTFIWAFRMQDAGYEARCNAAALCAYQASFGHSASASDGAPVSPASGGTPVSPKAGGRSAPRILIVPFGSRQWERALASAKYWVFNFKISDYLRPKKEQVFVQTWHGTPLKKLGYDVTHFDNPTNSARALAHHYGIEARKFTYFLSPSPYASEKFRSAWRLDRYGRENVILEEGYPRNDALIGADPREAERIRRRILGGDAAGGRRVVLYAPTYRQNRYRSAGGYAGGMPLDIGRLRRKLGDDYVILFRSHYFIDERTDPGRYRGFVYDVSDADDINELYLISDILVTDYSSVMFDYALLKRPMIFYMYDLEYYRDVSNGFYFDPQEVLPGPIVRTQEELAEAILAAGTRGIWDPDRYARFLAEFAPHEDGCACARVAAKIFPEH